MARDQVINILGHLFKSQPGNHLHKNIFNFFFMFIYGNGDKFLSSTYFTMFITLENIVEPTLQIYLCSLSYKVKKILNITNKKKSILDF